MNTFLLMVITSGTSIIFVAQLQHRSPSPIFPGKFCFCNWWDQDISYSNRTKLLMRFFDFLLRYDKAGRFVKAYLKILNWEVLSHPLYSPDIAPLDYQLLQHMVCLNHTSHHIDTNTCINPWLVSKEGKTLGNKWPICVLF